MLSSKPDHVGLLLAVVGLAGLLQSCGEAPGLEPGTGAGGDGGTGGGGSSSQPLELLVEDLVVAIENGRSKPLEFVAPPDVLSLSISMVGEPDKRYWICDWVTDDGFVLVPPGWEQLEENLYVCETCNNRVLGRDGVMTALAPNSTAAKVTSGTHTLTLCGEDFIYPLDGEVRVHVTAKRGATVPSFGVLDLNLLFTGAETWTAETAPTDPSFQSELSQLGEIFAQAGITLGNVTYTNLGAEKAIIAEDALAGIYQSLDPSLPLAVNVAFFEHVEANGLGFIAASAGVPGPHVKNTTHGGVALSMREVRQYETLVHRLIAHEVGHFLGLFHTTEVVTGGADPLDDTATGDVTNLMHAQPKGDRLTPEQARVLRLSPFVRN